MITEYRIKGSLGIACGMLCHHGGFIATNLGTPRSVAFGAYGVATLVLTYGCVNYARAKGYSPLLGLLNLLGLVGLLHPSSVLMLGFSGLVIVCALPDRTPPEFTTDAQRQAHEKVRAAARRENKLPPSPVPEEKRE